MCRDCIMVQHGDTFSTLHFVTYSGERTGSFAHCVIPLMKRILKRSEVAEMYKGSFMVFGIIMHVLRIYYAREWLHSCRLTMDAFRNIKQVKHQIWGTSESSIRQMLCCTTLLFSCTTIPLTHSLSVWSSSSVLFFSVSGIHNCTACYRLAQSFLH